MTSPPQPVSIYGMNAQHIAKGVALVAHLKGVPFDFATVNLITGEQRGEAYKKIHPIGRCPSLADGDLVLHEARAIARYLDKKSPLNPLVPTDPAQCAVFEEYMSIESCETWPRLNQVLRQELFTGIYNVPRDPVFLDRMISEVGPWLDMFEAALGKTNAFICGPAVTLVDVFQFVVLEYFWFMLPEHKKSLFGPRPALTAWFERMLALPAWVELHETKKLAYLHDVFAAMAKAKV